MTLRRSPHVVSATIALLLLSVMPIPTTAGRVPSGRPVSDSSPTTVRVRVFILNVDTIDSAEQVFNASVFLAVRWHDPSLAHNGKLVRRALDQVWHPQFQILNQQSVSRTFPETVDVLGNGDVIYLQRFPESFAAPMEVQDFPFDRQVLTIPFLAVGHQPGEIEIVEFVGEDGRQSGIAPKFSVPDWTVEGREAKPVLYEVVPGLPGIPAMVFSIQVARKWEYYIIKVILPLCLIVAMSWVSFWIDPEQTGTNVSVAMTSVLTIVAYRFAIGQMVGKVSYLTRMDAFIFGSMLLVFFIVGRFVINTSLVKKGQADKARQLDQVARVVIPVMFVVVTLWTLLVF